MSDGKQSVQLSPDQRRLLRLIVFAGVVGSAGEMIGYYGYDVDDALHSLHRAGLIDVDGVIVPTNAGVEALAAWYAADRSALAEPRREQILNEFRPLDKELKRVCSAWQEAGARDDWDSRMEAIEALTALHDATAGFVERHTQELPRFVDFRERLSRAHSHVLDGDVDYFVGVTVDSYHTIWSQFHEDLLRVLERERDPE